MIHLSGAVTGLSESPEETNLVHRSMIRRVHPSCLLCSQPQKVPNLRVLPVKCVLRRLVATVRHVGSDP